METVEIRSTSLTQVPVSDLDSVARLYPYEIWMYKDLNLAGREFLRKGFEHLPADAQVLAISNHNGYGKQWGVILLRRPEMEYWALVGEFGHTGYMEEFWRLRIWLMRKCIWYNAPANYIRQTKMLGALK